MIEKTVTKEIQLLLSKTEVLKFNQPCENVKFLFGDYESDVLSLNKNGYLTEFEVKVSRTDFLADKNKNKWQNYKDRIESRMCNYFVYVCPEGLIKDTELPEFAGLMYVINQRLKLIKKPKLLHKYKHERNKILTKFCTVMAERMYLGNCRLTYENKLRAEKQKEYEKETL